MSTKTLERLFDETVEYKLPKAGSIGAQVDRSVKQDVLSAVRDTYLNVNRKLYDTDEYVPITQLVATRDSPEDSDDKLTRVFGPKYLLPPRYVAAVDVFYPQMIPLLLDSGNGLEFIALPAGHASAFYEGETKSLAIDTMAIPGTPKNTWAQNLYRRGLNVVDRLVRSNPSVYGTLRNLKEFYSGILDTLSSRKKMKETLVHEMSHHVLQEEGLAPYLTSPVNEGLTENLTEYVTGEGHSLEGTTYHDFKTRVRSGYSRFVNSAKSFLRKFRERGSRLVDDLYRQPEVKPLVGVAA